MLGQHCLLKIVLWSGSTVKSHDFILVNFSILRLPKIIASRIIVIYCAKKKSCVWCVSRTFPLLFRHFPATFKVLTGGFDGWRIESTKISLCNCQELVLNLLAILPLFDCQVETWSVKFAIHIFSFSIAISWLPDET